MKLDDGGKQLQGELAVYIEKYTGKDGTHSTRIPDLDFIRASKESEPIRFIHESALCIVAQVTKLIMLAKESYLYGPSSYLVVLIWKLNPRGGENDDLFHISVYRLEAAMHQRPCRLSGAASK